MSRRPDSGIHPALFPGVRPKSTTDANKSRPADQEDFAVRFNLRSLVVFSGSLILASGGLVLMLMLSLETTPGRMTPTLTAQARAESTAAPTAIPAWGELVAQDVEIGAPEEYLAADYDTNRVALWIFDGLRIEQVKEKLLACGLSNAQVESALQPELVVSTPTNTLVKPEVALIISLSPETRAKLYGWLARSPANLYMHYPACFSGTTFELSLAESKVDPEVIALIKPLLYRRGDAQYFSDYEVVMQRVTSPEQRFNLLKAFSRQPAVLARLRIRPTTDIDKLLGYWTQTPRVRAKDLRPLLESLMRLPDGGTVSLVYFLPPFARERLYTYPMPPRVGEPAMDCHWSSLNFFNDQPDDRLGNPGFAGACLTKDYYPVQKPSAYGDVIVLVDENNSGVHSAVYIADGIVFTKNGNNLQQPWMLMRLPSLLAKYAPKGNLRTIVYRHKNS